MGVGKRDQLCIENPQDRDPWRETPGQRPTPSQTEAPKTDTLDRDPPSETPYI